MTDRVGVVLPASGCGMRCGGPISKQYVKIRQVPIFIITACTVQSWSWVHDIVITVPPGEEEMVRTLLAEHCPQNSGTSDTNSFHVVAGKSTRQLSIQEGLKVLCDSCGYNRHNVVIIHDAVRPFIYEEIAINIVKAAREYGGAIAVCPLVSNVISKIFKEKENEHDKQFFKAVLPREEYCLSETPQAFQLKHLLDGYAQINVKTNNNGINNKVYDMNECADVACRGGAEVQLCPGDPSRLFKITYKTDLLLAQCIFPGGVAVVTGGSKGIGKEVVKMLAERQFKVVVAARTRENVMQVAKENNGLGVVCDVSKSEDVHQLFQTVKNEFGRLDVLVNSAGILHLERFENDNEESWRSLIETNVMGVFRCSQHAMRLMKKQAHNGGGIIVNVGSSCTDGGRPMQSGYTVSKTLMHGMTDSIALEGREFNIHCYNVVPRRTNTSMRQDPDGLAVEDVAAAVLQPIIQWLPTLSGNEIWVR